MANLIIPLTSTTSNFRQVVSLDGVSYTLSFLWNDRATAWFCELRSQDGEVLAAYRKICVDQPWIYRDSLESLPAGQLWFFTTDGGGIDPGLLDLGVRVQLEYVIEENAL